MTDFTILTTESPKHMLVSQAAGIITQPRGGYLSFKDFQEDTFEDEEFIDRAKENILASLVSLTVDYLSKYLLTNKKDRVFKKIKVGLYHLENYAALLAVRMLDEQSESYSCLDKEISSTDWKSIYYKLMNQLDLELSDQCITASVKLAYFDVIYGRGPEYFTGIRQVKPNKMTKEHIRKLVHRTLEIIKNYGEIIGSDINFYRKTYTDQIIAGGADYLTEDTLWNLGVIEDKFDENHSIQLLLAWRLGMKQNHRKYSKVKYIGIISPRHNKAYRYDLSQIPQEFIDFLDYKVIGYKQK